METGRATPSAVTITRWLARLLGTPLALFVLVFVGAHIVGDEPPPDPGVDPQVLLGIMAMTTLSISAAGLLVAWKWEGLGGLLSVAGVAGFYGVALAASGELLAGWHLPVLSIPGFLYLLAWWLGRGAAAGGLSTRQA